MFLFTTNLLALNILFPPGGNAAACSNTASCFGEAKHEMEMADRCYIFCHYAGLHHNFGSKGHRQDVILQSWRLGSDTNDMQIGRSKTTTDLPALCQSICIFVKSPLFFAAFMFRSVQFFFTGQEKKNTKYCLQKNRKRSFGIWGKDLGLLLGQCQHPPLSSRAQSYVCLWCQSQQRVHFIDPSIYFHISIFYIHGL